MFHGSAIDQGDGNYAVSAWPVVAGAYQMSVLIRALEPSRWALGYRRDITTMKPLACRCRNLLYALGIPTQLITQGVLQCKLRYL